MFLWIDHLFFDYLFNLDLLKLLWWIYFVVFAILFAISGFGRQLGLRRKYTEFLLKVFEFAYKRVSNRNVRQDDQALDEDSETSIELPNLNLSFDHPKPPGSWDEFEGYKFDGIVQYTTCGVAAIVSDSVTPQFVSQELPYWNLLSRTNTKAYEFISLRLTLCWAIGFLIRYLLMLPLRVIILAVGFGLIFICTSVVGIFPNGPRKRKLNYLISIFCFDYVAGCLSLVATFHDVENRPQSGIAVANHTTPIDTMILSTDAVYDMIGQKHGGLLGIFMYLLGRSSSHIWFERSEIRDRSLVTKRLVEHASNSDLPPILIFPEGVCVNNTSVMQFKKGAFEARSIIHPIAIKFDPRYGDAFWWQDQFSSYILYMMTSWAIVCDVWYLPPMERRENESSELFAARVKGAIAAKAGLIDNQWDGFLKAKPIKEEWREQQRRAFADYVKGGIMDEIESKEHEAPLLKKCVCGFVDSITDLNAELSKTEAEISSSTKNEDTTIVESEYDMHKFQSVDKLESVVETNINSVPCNFSYNEVKFLEINHEDTKINDIEESELKFGEVNRGDTNINDIEEESELKFGEINHEDANINDIEEESELKFGEINRKDTNINDVGR